MSKLDEINYLFRDNKQFVLEDSKSLIEIVGKLKESSLVLEVGSWEGHSTAVLASVVKGKVFAVDHWKGNTNSVLEERARYSDIFAIFKLNLKRLGLWDKVYPLMMDSETASNIFKDEYLDMVFIDSDHLYKNITKDIEMWLPKVKQGGIICGHDAEYYYSKLQIEDQKIINEHLDIDYFTFGGNIETGAHPGIIKALYEKFNDEHILLPRRMWYCQL